MKRRVITLVTALALCLSLCPTWALAAAPEPDGGLCPHHPAHTETCGYVYDEWYGDSPENAGGSCAFVCRVCPIEDLIGQLPLSVTADNKSQVEDQLNTVLALYTGLTEEEQDQLDLSRCFDLQAQLDAASVPMLISSAPGNFTWEQTVRLSNDKTSTSVYQVDFPIRFDLSGYSYTATATTAFQVLNACGVYFIGTGAITSQKGSGVEVSSGGKLYIDSESSLTISGSTYGLDLASGAVVELSGGTFTGNTAAIRTAKGDFGALLKSGYAYFDADGSPIPLTQAATEKTVVVKACTDHLYSYTHNSGRPTHAWTCTACGKKVSSEPCTFRFDENGVGTCDYCGSTAVIAINEDDLADLVYDGTVKPENVQLTVTLNDGSGKVLTKGTDYTVDYEPRTDVGEITVTVTGKTFRGTFTKTYHVEQDRPVIEWSTPSAAVDYDGSPAEKTDLPAVTIRINAPGEDLSQNLQYFYKRNTEDDSAYTEGLPTNAGTYDIVARLPESQNYQAASSAPLALTINRIDPRTEYPAAKSLTYNGGPQKLITAGIVREGAVIEYLQADGSYSTDIPTGINAQSYTVLYRVAETENYKEVPPTSIEGVRILPRWIEPTIKVSEPSYVYDSTRKNPEITVLDGITVVDEDQYTITWSPTPLVNIGTYTADIRSKSSGNYTFTAKATVEIVPASQNALSITGKPNHVYYGDTVRTLSAEGGTGEGTVSWTLSGGASASTIDPATGVLDIKEMGTFTVKAERTVPNYGTVTASWTFTVEPKPVMAEVTVAPKEYDGSTAIAGGAVTARVKAGDLVNSGDTVTISGLTGTYDNASAGTNKIVILDSGNASVGGADKDKYSVSYPLTARGDITPKAVAMAVLPDGRKDLPYHGTPQDLITPGWSDDGTVMYSLSKEGPYDTKIPTGTDVGQYQVWYKVKGDGNHSDRNPVAVDASIVTNNVTQPTIQVSPATFTGREQEPIVTVLDDSGLPIAGKEYKVEADRALIDAGEYTLTITSTGGNYTFDPTDGKNTAKFTISPADQEPLTIVGTQERVYYGDKIQLGTMGGSGNITWSVGGSKIASIDENGLLTIKGVGSVTVTAASDDPNHSPRTAVWPFYAAPKRVTAVVTAASKTYDEKIGAAVTAKLQNSDLVYGDTVSITLAGKFRDPNAGANKEVIVDSSNPKVTGTGGYANYEIVYPGTATASIFKADIKAEDVKAPSVKTGLTYSGSPLELVTPGSCPYGMMEYSLDGLDYSPSIPTRIDAGSCSIWYKVRGDGNHKDTEEGTELAEKAAIGPQNVEDPIVELDPPSATYDGGVKRPEVKVKDKSGLPIPEREYTVEYNPGTEWTEQDTYYVTVKDNSGGNYNITGKTVEFKILPTGQNPLSITNQPRTIYYGDSFTLSAVGGSGTGAVRWGSSDDTIAKFDENGLVTILKAGGPVTVTAKKLGDGNYKEVSVTWTFYAAPKPVTPVVTAKDREYADGNTSAELVITWKDGDLLRGDTIDLALTGQFVNADAGTDKTVKISGAAPVGGNYEVRIPETTTATITKKTQVAGQLTGEALTYNGSEQDLLAESKKGLYEFSLAKDGPYSTTVPTGKNADRYTVWYRLPGDDNHKESEPKAFVTTIGPKTVENPVIELSNTTFIYDGTEKRPTVIKVEEQDGTLIPVGEYTVSYRNNLYVGDEAEVIITNNNGGNYIVNGSTTFEIKADAGGGDNTGEGETENNPGEGSTENNPGGETDSGSNPGGTTGSGTNTNYTPAPSGPGTVSAPMQTSVQNGTASTVLSAAGGDKLVSEAVANQSQNVVIKPEITGSVTKAEVSIPTSTVSQLKSRTTADLTVSTPVADVTIPNGALGTLSGVGGAVKVVTEQVDQAVSLKLTANGRSVENVPGGLTLTVPVEDAAPGTVAVLVREDGTRETIRKAVAEDGRISVPLDGPATVEIVDNSKSFDDVPAESWAADAVAFASAHELFNGTSETAFSPDQLMSRGMLANVLYNLEGRPAQSLTDEFSDIGSDAWYAQGVSWAAENGIAAGYGGGRFGPNDSITREQFVVMLWRYAGSPEANGQALSFTDADQVSGYAAEALRWAVANGILNGYGNGQLDPGGPATRAQAAQMLKNFMENT